MTLNETEDIVQLLQGAYPNTDMVDSEITAGTWFLIFGNDNYKFEEVREACINIIKTETKGWKINIAEVLEELREIRIKKRDEERRKAEEERIKNTVPCPPEVAHKYAEEIREWLKNH